MKICLVNSLYDPYVRGGAEDVVKILAEYLSGQGHAVYVITTDSKQHIRPHISLENKGKIKIYRLGGYNLRPFYYLSEIGPFLRHFWHLNDVFAFKSKRLFKQTIDEIRPDLIWMHNIKGIGFGITKIAKQSPAKFWLTIHDVQYFDPSGLLIHGKKLSILYRIARSAYKRLVCFIVVMPDLLISPSQWLLDFYKAKDLFRKAKAVHLLNPIAGLKQLTESRSHNGFKIVFAGQVEKHKGVLTLVAAVKKYNKFVSEPVLLDVWGRGFLQDKIDHDDNIQLKGWVEFCDLANVLQNYDLLVVPSLCYENSPTIIRIAKHVGIPVLGSNLGGIPELLDINTGDYLFEPGNVDDLVGQLKIFANRKLSHKLRSAKEDITTSAQDYWEALSAKL